MQSHKRTLRSVVPVLVSTEVVPRSLAPDSADGNFTEELPGRVAATGMLWSGIIDELPTHEVAVAAIRWV